MRPETDVEEEVELEDTLREIWHDTEEAWVRVAKDSDVLDFPWVKAAFISKTFKLTLARKGLRIPSGIRGGF